MASTREWWDLYEEIHRRITVTQKMLGDLNEQAIQILTGRSIDGKRHPRLVIDNILGCLCGAQALLERLRRVVPRPRGPRPRREG
jgi:hypothetical protein